METTSRFTATVPVKEIDSNYKRIKTANEGASLIVHNRLSIREAADRIGVPRQTLLDRINRNLPDYNYTLYNACRAFLNHRRTKKGKKSK